MLAEPADVVVDTDITEVDRRGLEIGNELAQVRRDRVERT
jgi:hypothetical protein